MLRPERSTLRSDAVQVQVGDLQGRFDRGTAAPEQSSHPGGKFGVRKRLIDAVVCSTVQGVNAVFHARAGGQYENGELGLAGTNAAQDGNAVEFGKI